MIEWANMTFDEIALLDRQLPILWPLGVLEAHGHHLPVNTDTAAAEHICREVAARTECILLPVLNYGYVGYGWRYPGTLGIRMETLAHVLEDTLSLLHSHGFCKVLMVSGHGANLNAHSLAAARLAQTAPRLRTRYINWWIEAGFEVHHAGAFETETAQAMGLEVKMSKAQAHTVDKTWYHEVSRHELHPDTGGVNGDPHEADTLRGQYELQRAVDVLVQLVTQARQDSTVLR